MARDGLVNVVEESFELGERVFDGWQQVAYFLEKPGCNAGKIGVGFGGC
jgi:hypothetical protein